MNPLNIKLTLGGLNFIIKLLGEQPNKSGSYPLLIELQNQGKAEVDRINAAKSLPSGSQNTETA